MLFNLLLAKEKKWKQKRMEWGQQMKHIFTQWFLISWKSLKGFSPFKKKISSNFLHNFFFFKFVIFFETTTKNYTLSKQQKKKKKTSECTQFFFSPFFFFLFFCFYFFFSFSMHLFSTFFCLLNKQQNWTN